MFYIINYCNVTLINNLIENISTLEWGCNNYNIINNKKVLFMQKIIAMYLIILI